MYRLIALDLDDTLLNGRGEVPPLSREALAAARRAGVEVTLVTARAFPATRCFVQELELALPVLCMTGAARFAPDGTLLAHTPLAAAAAAQLAHWADVEGWCVRVYAPDGGLVQSRLPDDFTPRGAAVYRPAHLVGAVSPHVAAVPPLQLVLLGHRSTEGALARLGALPDVTATPYDRHTGQARVHLMHRNVNKGAALAALCADLGIPRASVIAMGDGDTDLSMIRWAGAGVAMGRAPAPVQAAARLVTDPDDPEPVASALRALLGQAVPGPGE